MNLNKIQYFLSSVEEQSFTKAARKHYVTQVAVTQQIASMERELDTELFERNGNRIKVTPAGRFFYDEMKKMMGQYQFTLEQLQEYRGDSRREIRIGISTLSDYEWILPYLNGFQREHPDVDYTFQTGEHKTLLEKVKTGKLSVMFSSCLHSSDTEELDMLPAYYTKISLVVHDRHPLFQKEAVSVQDFEGLPLILIGSEEYERNQTYQDFYQLCRENGFIPRIVCHAADSMEAMIKADRGLGCVLYMDDARGILAEHPRRKILTLSGPARIQKYVVYRRHSMYAAVDELIAYLARACGILRATNRADLRSDFSQLWREALKQEDGTYSRRLSDDQAEKEFWHHFMQKKSRYQQDSWAHVIMREVKNLLAPCSIHTIMEIGPGWGNFTMELADCCDTLTCVDISEDVLEYISRAAREMGKKNIFSICSKWENMRYQDNRSDVVFGYNCFYRMLDLRESLAIMNQIGTKLCIMGMSVEAMTPYDRELQEQLGANVIYDKKDYIHFVNILYQMGIDANVKIIPLSKELVWSSWEQAVSHVVSRIRDGESLMENHRDTVERILGKYFQQEADGSWHYRLRYRGALVWWEPVAPT